MKKINMFYWIVTALFALFMGFSALGNIMVSPESIQMVSTQLGYPEYFIPFIGVAKLLGVIAILIPGFPRIKEWAYAGLVFDLISAWYSFYASGTADHTTVFMILPIALAFGSYWLYHKRLKAIALN